MFKKIKLFFFVFLVLFILLVAYGLVSVLVSNFSLNDTAQESVIKIENKSIIVEVMDSPMAKARGLSGREFLEENRGMFFVFKNLGRHGFWMKDMKFPIDIIWLKDNLVVGFEENVPIQPGVSNENLIVYYPPESINRVLELSAGSVERLNIIYGQDLRIE